VTVFIVAGFQKRKLQTIGGAKNGRSDAKKGYVEPKKWQNIHQANLNTLRFKT
ncbi:hypothetical protein SAMN05216323_10791, partial [Williamwhitmania taraxaci]